MDAQEIFDEFSRPFLFQEVEWRVGSVSAEQKKGMALAYMTARSVMDRLDSVVGPANWQRRYPVVNGKNICALGVKFGDEWVWKEDGADDTDIEGTKGGLSDAFKRAAVNFCIGRYLYSVDSPWVPIVQRGKTWIIADEAEKQLQEAHAKAAESFGWGDPTDRATMRVVDKLVREIVTQPEQVAPFLERYKGELPMLRVAQRKYLINQLDRIGGTLSEAAE
jgi:hypothetical protein